MVKNLAAFRCCAGALALAMGLQFAPVSAQQSAEPEPVDAADEADPSEVIVVTGSRILRPGEVSSTPIVALGGEELENAGAVSVGEVVRQLPALAPGLNSESSGITFNGAGLDLLDLRSLGTNRTLVLVNGRRQVGSSPNTTAVDVNTIPTSLIERVEVLTGGASAVYGADAVSGVVNFILKRDFEGFQFDGQAGVSSRGDAGRHSFSLLAGSNFDGGRGNVTAYISYSREGGIEYDAREGSISGLNWVPNPASTGPNDGVDDYILLDNVRQLGGQIQSAFVLNRGSGLEAFGFNDDGSVRPFAIGPSGLIAGGQFTDGGEAELGYDSICPQAKCALRIPVERYLVSGNAWYEVFDGNELYFEGRFADTKSSSRFGSVFEIPPVTNQISIDNPYVSPSLAALMTEAGVTSIGILRSDQELGLRGQDTDRRLFQLVGGMRGELGIGDFRYDASAQYGSVSFTNTRVNDVDQQRFLYALDAVRATDGTIQCRSAVAQAERCVPINFLQDGAAITDEALAYIRIPFATETAELSQFVASANVTGSLGDFWGAGPIRIAAGVEYREEDSTYLVSPVDQQGRGFYFTRRQSTRGGFNVFDAYAEAIVPIVSDVPFFDTLEVEAAIRSSKYSTSGSTLSWKVGGTYAPVSDLRLRAVYARAVRAPNVGELFSPGSEGFLTVDDPCDVNFITGGAGNRAANCSALGVPGNFVSNARTINIRTSTSGNPGLDVEKADTLTIGGVFKPSFLPGFIATVDYFRIKITDAINVFSAQAILDNCVDLADINNPFCASIERAATGDINRIQRQSINVSELEREGIDVELRYRQELGDLGRLDLGLLGTKMLAVTTVVAPGTVTGSNVIDFKGEYGFPEWKARAGATWTMEPFDLTGTLTYFSSLQRDVQPTNPEDNRATAATGDFYVFNTQLGFEVRPEARLYLGVDNLFDNQPPALPDVRSGGASSFAGAEIFPIAGRFFYAGVSVKF